FGGTMVPVSVENRSVRRLAAVPAGVKRRFEWVFERRIPVAATVAAREQQPERQDGENEPRCPHHRFPEYPPDTRSGARARARLHPGAKPCLNRPRSIAREAGSASVPIPKFAPVCGSLRSELRNRRTLATL